MQYGLPQPEDARNAIHMSAEVLRGTLTGASLYKYFCKFEFLLISLHVFLG